MCQLNLQTAVEGPATQPHKTSVARQASMTDAWSKAEGMLDEPDCKETDKASKLIQKALWRPFET